MSVIGLDAGTSRVKAVRFDSDWQVEATAIEATAVLRPGPGRCEQDMNEVWAAAARVISGVAAPDVDLLAVTAQGDGTWLVNQDAQPAGNALLWNDSRATSVIEDWQRDGTLDQIFGITGSLGAPGLAHAQLAWLSRHEPDRLNGASTLLSCGSWLYAQLTGQVVLHASEAANPFTDVRTGEYSDAVLDVCGISTLRRLLPRVVSGASATGTLTPLAAAALNLDAGTQVALAPYDVVASTIGVGAIHDGAATAILGTTMCVGVSTGSPMLDRAPSGMTLPFGHDGRWLTAQATLAGTEILEWAARMLGLPGAEQLIALAATAEGPNRPLLLPYLSPAGERAPFLDTHARGAVIGLSLEHTPADIARAVLDGLTAALGECLQAAGGATKMFVTGGGSTSEAWCQLISNATQMPIYCANTAETGARGAAISATLAHGRYPDLSSAVAEAVLADHVHTPDTTVAQIYIDQRDRLGRALQSGVIHL